MMLRHTTVILLIKAQTCSVLPFGLLGNTDSYWQTRHYRTEETEAQNLWAYRQLGCPQAHMGSSIHPDTSGVTFRMHNPWRWRQCLHPKRCYFLITLYYIIIQMIWIPIVVKTSNIDTLLFNWEFRGKYHFLLQKLSYWYFLLLSLAVLHVIGWSVEAEVIFNE